MRVRKNAGNIMKRSAALFLALVMICAMFPAEVFADLVWYLDESGNLFAVDEPAAVTEQPQWYVGADGLLYPITETVTEYQEATIEEISESPAEDITEPEEEPFTYITGTAEDSAVFTAYGRFPEGSEMFVTQCDFGGDLMRKVFPAERAEKISEYKAYNVSFTLDGEPYDPGMVPQFTVLPNMQNPLGTLDVAAYSSYVSTVAQNEAGITLSEEQVDELTAAGEEDSIHYVSETFYNLFDIEAEQQGENKLVFWTDKYAPIVIYREGFDFAPVPWVLTADRSVNLSSILETAEIGLGLSDIAEQGIIYLGDPELVKMRVHEFDGDWEITSAQGFSAAQVLKVLFKNGGVLNIELYCEGNEPAPVAETEKETWNDWVEMFANVELTGNWPQDVVTIAKTQLGYAPDEDGYTRYGGWYGDAYADWCAMFCSFCMAFAGVNREIIPFEESCTRWVDALKVKELYYEASSGYSPKAGDLIFFSSNGVEADHVGIVYDNEPGQIVTIDGNNPNAVEHKFYLHDDARILGYGEMPERMEEPPVVLTAELENGLRVTAQGDIPEGATLAAVPADLTELTDEQAYINANYPVAEGMSRKFYAYDISLRNGDLEVEPAEGGRVTVTLFGLPANAAGVQVLHLTDRAETPVQMSAEQPIAGADPVELPGMMLLAKAPMLGAAASAGAKDNYVMEEATINNGEVTLTVSSFSTFLFTVDFAFDGYRYSMAGESEIFLSDLFLELNIGENIAEVISVAFSDETLVKAEPVYAEDGTTIIDWKLISLLPFCTNETLTICFVNGRILVIDVTDPPSGGLAAAAANPCDQYLDPTKANAWQVVTPYDGNAFGNKTATPVDLDNDGKADAWLQKNVLPTGVENEFYVYLSLARPIDAASFLKNATLHVAATNNGDGLGVLASSLPGSYKADMGPQVDDPSLDHGDLYVKIDIYETATWTGSNWVGNGDHLAHIEGWRTFPGNVGCNNGSIYLKVNINGNVQYLKLANQTNLGKTDRGSGHPFQITLGYDKLSNVGVFFDRTKTNLDVVYDTVGSQMEFICDESSILYHDGPVTYSSTDEQGNPILEWHPQEKYIDPVFVGSQPYRGTYNNISQLVYKVRLKTEEDGFDSCADNMNSTVEDIDSYKVNESARLEYTRTSLEGANPVYNWQGGTADFEIPYVRGLLYDLRFQKVSNSGTGLSGAVFRMLDEDRNPIKDESGSDITFTSGENGYTDILSLPVLPEYIEEITPPTGYLLPTTAVFGPFVNNYTQDNTKFVQETLADHTDNMRSTEKDTGTELWKIQNRLIPVDPVKPTDPPRPTFEPAEVTLKKQIDYLGDNPGATDEMKDLYRLYLSLDTEVEPLDLLLVLDQSGSMTLPMGDQGLTRQHYLNVFLNGTAEDGFIADFLDANKDNRLAILTFGSDCSNSRILRSWESTGRSVYLDPNPDGATNYAAALDVAGDILNAAGGTNRKIMIFLSDGEPTIAYADGQMHRSFAEPGNVVGYGNNCSLASLGAFITLYIYYHNSPSMVDYWDSTLNEDITTPDDAGYYHLFKNRFFEPYSSMSSNNSIWPVTYDITTVELNIPGTNFPAKGVTDQTEFNAFITMWNGLTDEGKLEWLEEHITFPGNKYDLFYLTESAFLQFQNAHPAVPTYTVAFSDFEDLPSRRPPEEVLQYMSGEGRFYPCSEGETLADTINKLAGISNITMTDPLSEYVDAADAPELVITLKTGPDEDHLSTLTLYENGTFTADGQKYLDTANTSLAPAGLLNVKLKEGCILSGIVHLEASFNVRVNEHAYETHAAEGYNATGDEDTDYPGNDTSSLKPGFYSNDGAKATWTAIEDDEEDFPDPVVQVSMNDIQLKKVDASDSGKALAGAEFDLYREISSQEGADRTYTDAEGNVHYLKKINASPIVSDRSGLAEVSNLQQGSYWLFELKAPDGYIPFADPVHFNLGHTQGASSEWTITTDAANAQTDPENLLMLIVENERGYELPETGGEGISVIYATGALLMASACIYGIILKRKRERRAA